MQYEGNILWLEAKELLALGLSENLIKNGIYRARNGGFSWQNKPDPIDARRKLINYDTIPSTTIEKYGIPSKAHYLAKLEQDAHQNSKHELRAIVGRYVSREDMDYFISEGYSPEESKGFAQTAAWLSLLANVRGKNDVKNLGIEGLKTKLDVLNLSLATIMEDPPHGLHNCTNVQVLRKKMSRFREAVEASRADGLRTLRHGLKGRASNKRKIDDRVAKILTALYVNEDSDIKLNYQQIFESYELCVLNNAVDASSGEVYTDLPHLHPSTVRAFLARPEMRMLDHLRHGDKHFRDAVRPYIKGQRAKFSFSFTSSDGFVMPFWLKKSEVGAAWKRPYCYVIFDTHSMAILGWAIGMQENYELMQRAFIDMIQRTGGRMAVHNQLDNFNKFFKDELDLISGTKFTAPYNSQSKYAETYIGTLKYTVMNTYEGFTGRYSNKDAKNRRNPDKPNPATDAQMGYTWEEMNKLMESAMKVYNSRKEKGSRYTREQMLQMHINPSAPQPTNLQLTLALGYRSKATIERGYIIKEYEGQTYTYQIPDYATVLTKLSRQSQRVRVRWLPHLLGQEIHVYDYDGKDDPAHDTFICTAIYQEGTQRAPTEQSKDSGRNLGRQLRWQREFDEAVAAQEAAIKDAKILPLTPDEAEDVLAAGYTDKHEMQEAADVAEQSEKRKVSRWQ